MTTPGFWTNVRFLLFYPVLVTFGIAWFVAFWLRWRRTHCIGDFWSGILGGAVTVWAFTGILSLWLAKLTGFGNQTSLIFAIGTAVPTLVVIVGVVTMFWRGWRNAKN